MHTCCIATHQGLWLSLLWWGLHHTTSLSAPHSTGASATCTTQGPRGARAAQPAVSSPSIIIIIIISSSSSSSSSSSLCHSLPLGSATTTLPGVLATGLGVALAAGLGDGFAAGLGDGLAATFCDGDGVGAGALPPHSHDVVLLRVHTEPAAHCLEGQATSKQKGAQGPELPPHCSPGCSVLMEPTLLGVGAALGGGLAAGREVRGRVGAAAGCGRRAVAGVCV
jgi:hypothetical protein